MKVKPFFTKEETQKVSLNLSQDSACQECGLYKNCLSPKMQVTGDGAKNTLLIAEAPGKTEDEAGMQLIGDAGQYLRDKLADHGLKLDRDFKKTNALACRPPNNRKPKRKELKLCRPNYMQIIEEMKPKNIWLVGAAAIESFYMDRFVDEDDESDSSGLTPTRWRGLCIPDSLTGAWVTPIFHPSFGMRNIKDDLIQSQYDRDLSFAIACMQKKPPVFHDLKKYVKVVKSFEDVKALLINLIENPPEFLIFDYESTGLKPFDHGHKIASISFSADHKSAYSFPLEYPHFTSKQVEEIKKLWSKVLKNNSFKVAHNLKFEDVWSRVILNTLPDNWHWCTMNAAHILDNRKHFSGLKFQAFIRWGVEQYDKTVAPFLKDRTGSGFNNVMKAPLDDLLLYGGYDSLLTRWLFEEQGKEMTSEKLRKSNQFFVDGLLALSDVQVDGICMDKSYYMKCDDELGDQLKDITKKLISSEEAKLFKETTGRDIKFTSDADLRKLFYDIMKYTPTKFTDGEQPSVDAEALRALGSPMADLLIKSSKIDKIKGTYVGQFLREINDDGKTHPFQNLHTVQTYRGSSNRPNWHNIPVRDEEAKRYTRSGVYPSPGNLILDWDYGALEVRIIGAITKDPTLVNYIKNPATDMHRDKAMEIFKLPQKEVTKMIRFHAKNGFVFAMFYGSWYRSCGESLWETMHRDQLKTVSGKLLLDHLVEIGIIKDHDDLGKAKKPVDDCAFLGHLRGVEKKFWNDFPVVKRWQERNIEFYKNNGYIELITGFRCSGYMKRNNIANYPIQGPAFHCLLWSLININEEIKRRKLKTKIMGHIHDCCLFDCPPEEKNIMKEISTDIATKQIRKEWSWLDVPLILEFEETKVNGSWYSKKEIRED